MYPCGYRQYVYTSVQGTYFHQVIFGTKFKFSENQSTLRFHYPYWAPSILLRSRHYGGRHVTQRAEFAKKVHKPPLGVNVINFELNGLGTSIWVPWSPSDPKKLWCTDKSIQIHNRVEVIIPAPADICTTNKAAFLSSASICCYSAFFTQPPRKLTVDDLIKFVRTATLINTPE